MVFPSSFRDRELHKFFADNDNETAVRVGNSASSPIYTTEIVTASSGVIEYAEVNSVPSSLLTTIATYTVPVGKTMSLRVVEVSGNNLGIYQIEFDTIVKSKKRTYWGKFNETFVFEDQPVSTGTVIRVRVIHTSSMLGEFNATIIGALK